MLLNIISVTNYNQHRFHSKYNMILDLQRYGIFLVYVCINIMNFEKYFDIKYKLGT